MKKWFMALFIPATLSGCNVEKVDPAPATAVAQAFYKALEAGDPKTALNYLSQDFTTEPWPRLLNSLNDRYGPVTSADLQGSNLVSDGQSPCYLLTFVVKRHALEEDDILFVCRHADASHWSIRGHSLTRRDTGQRVVGGALPSEVGLKAL